MKRKNLPLIAFLIAWLFIISHAFSQKTNFKMDNATHLVSKTYPLPTILGIGVGIDDNNQIYVAGKYDPDTNQIKMNYKTGYLNKTLFGLTDSVALMQLNSTLDTIKQIVWVGSYIYDYEMSNNTNNKIMAVSTNLGVTMFASNGWDVLYAITAAQLNQSGFNGKVKIDIDAKNNNLVVLKSELNSTSPGRGALSVYDSSGNKIGTTKLIDLTEIGHGSAIHVTDVTINNDTVYVSGYTQETTSGAVCGSQIGFPVQSAFIRAYKVSMSSWSFLWETYGFEGKYLADELADTRIYQLNIGVNGELYMLGEVTGGSSVFSSFLWNGKDCRCNNGVTMAYTPFNTNVSYDKYNQLINTTSATFSCFAELNIRTGVVNRSQYIIPRLSNGNANSYRVTNTEINADIDGNVYIGGYSAMGIENRDSITLNNVKVGKYAGSDMSLFVTNASFTKRLFWGTFAKNDSAKGALNDIAINGKKVAILGNLSQGKNITGVTKNNVWNETYQLPSGPLSSYQSTYVAYWNNFTDTSSACPVSNFNYSLDNCTNCVPQYSFTDNSVNAISWLWNFGDGTTSTLQNPTHTFTTSGTKIVTLTVESLSGCVNIKTDSTYFQGLDNKYHSISGKVLATSIGCTSAVVIAYQDLGNYYKPVAIDLTDSLGAFYFTNLAEDSYVLYAIPNPTTYGTYLPTYFVNKLVWKNASKINLIGNAIDVDIHLFKLPTLTAGTCNLIGTVTFQDTTVYEKNLFATNWFTKNKAAQASLNAQNMPVIAYDQSGNPIGWALTDANGNYSINNLQAGTYDIDVNKAGFELLANNVQLTSGTSSVNFDIKQSNIILGEQELTKTQVKQNVGLRPNPVTSESVLYLSLTDLSNVTVEIINVMGNTVKTLTPESNQVIISKSEFSSGVYFYRVINNYQLIGQDTFIVQ